MPSIAEHIQEKLKKSPEGELVSPKDFLHLGSRDAVDRAFRHLLEKDDIARISRGLYAALVPNRFSESGKCTPSEWDIFAGLERRTGETLVLQGGACINVLGFSNQVPLRTILLTSGQNRKLRFGLCVVEIRHAPSWKLLFPWKFEGDLIRALDRMGEEWVYDYIPRIRNMGSKEEWKRLYDIRHQLPGWMAEVIVKIRKTKRRTHGTGYYCSYPVESSEPFC